LVQESDSVLVLVRSNEVNLPSFGFMCGMSTDV